MRERPLYLTPRDMSSLDISMAETIEVIEEMFAAKARGEFDSPAKLWMENPGRGFVSAMACRNRRTGWAVAKWQAASEYRMAQEKAYLSGLLVLSEGVDDGWTSGPACILDAAWISAMRTPAASAVAARHFAQRDANSVAIIGCGIQGRQNLTALAMVLPSLEKVLAYDIAREPLSEFARKVRTEFDLSCVECASAREAVSLSAVTVTAGRIDSSTTGKLVRADLRTGSLLITLDYDSYVTADALHGADLVVCDDLDQLTQIRSHGYFEDLPEGVAELADGIAWGGVKQVDRNSYVVSLLLGISPEDLVLAELVYQRALARGVGVRLD